MINDISSHFGHYKIISELGHGGFGHVYLASDMELERYVALKVLNSDLAGNPAMLRQFKREAKALGQMHHPNIVVVYSVQAMHFPPYIVMEHVDGMTLESYLQPGLLSLSDALPILGQIAAALDAAHKQGIVHRDVKPANVLISHEGIVKLTDFGLALMATDPTASQSKSAIGSVLYMAPEQGDIYRQHEIGPATDIYALGVITYQMLTGRVPFQGEDQYAILAAHRAVNPPDPRAFGINLSAEVVAILMQALAKEPTARHRSASQFVRLLREAISLEPVFISPPLKREVNQLTSSEAPTRQIHQVNEFDSLKKAVVLSRHQSYLYASLALVMFLALCVTVLTLGNSWSVTPQALALSSATIEVTTTIDLFTVVNQSTETPFITKTPINRYLPSDLEPATATAILPTETKTLTAIPPTETQTLTAIPPTETQTLTPTATETETPTIIPTITKANATPTPFPTQTIPPTQTPWPTDTPLPTQTPFVTNTLVPTQISLPTLTPLPTQTPSPTLPPMTPTPAFTFQFIDMGADFSRGCPGHYIFGYVRDKAGNLLGGQRIQIYSEYGIVIPPITSKEEPRGWYDVPISPNRSIWYVELVDESNNPISMRAEVLNTGNYVEGSEGCWHQVDFSRLD